MQALQNRALLSSERLSEKSREARLRRRCHPLLAQFQPLTFLGIKGIAVPRGAL